MNVTLINHDREALEQLLFTKATRLNMTPALLEEIRAWSPVKKLKEVQAMARTIPSSWEFVSLTFLVEGLSRADAQQVTRTRTASFAMQSMRVTDVREMVINKPEALQTCDEAMNTLWDETTEMTKHAYELLVDGGVPLQDARGILPIATSCNLVVRYNLRAFADMLKARESLRAQGPYREMAERMKALTLEVWPWAEEFFRPSDETAIAIIEKVAKDLGIRTGSGPGWELAKAVDLLRKG